MPACVFCGRDDRPLTKEHVWGAWLEREFPGLGDVDHVFNEAAADERSWVASAFSQQVRCVCQSCNSGWMSANNESAKPYLAAMIRGQQVKLSARRQRILATWALKTAMTSELAHPDKEHTIPKAHYRALWRTGVPPENETTIWTTRVRPRLREDGRVLMTEARRAHLVPLPGTPPEKVAAIEAGHTYAITLAVGAVLFLVLGSTDETIRAAELQPLRPEVLPLMRRIWPVRSRCTWPPSNASRDIGDIRDVRDAWIPRHPEASPWIC